MGCTDAKTPPEYRLMVLRFEDMNDELHFVDLKFCEIDEDIRDRFEWLANRQTVRILRLLIETENNKGKAGRSTSFCALEIAYKTIISVAGKPNDQTG
jgi:hypothetical protein